MIRDSVAKICCRTDSTTSVWGFGNFALLGKKGITFLFQRWRNTEVPENKRLVFHSCLPLSSGLIIAAFVAPVSHLGFASQSQLGTHEASADWCRCAEYITCTEQACMGNYLFSFPQTLCDSGVSSVHSNASVSIEPRTTKIDNDNASHSKKSRGTHCLVGLNFLVS